MLQLITLRFKNIGRFVEEQEIDFDSLGNFVQVDGYNSNTGGSSGSGKSTVFNALDYLLGLNNLAATILQSRLTEDPITVQGVFMWNDVHTVITRTKSKIDVRIGDTTVKQSRAEEKIDEILGMPRDLFRKVIHKRQKEGGFFLDFTPKEMHDFLMDCIGLSPFKKKYEIIEAEIANLEKIIEIENQSITSAKAGLSATQDAILALGLAPIQDMHKEVILELKEKYERSAVRFTDVKAQCESVDREFSKSRPDTTQGAHDGTIREALEKRGKEIEEEIQLYLREERDRQGQVRQSISESNMRRVRVVARIEHGEQAKREAAKIAGEIKLIRSQECPTCHQGWTTESAAVKEQAKLAELVTLKEIITDAGMAGNELVELDQEISALKSTLSPLISPQLPILNEELREVTQKILDDKRKAGEMYDQQNAETKAKLDAFVFQQGELRKKHDLDIDQARGQMDLDRRVLDSAVQKLRAYEVAKERYEQTYNELKKKEDLFEKHIAKCNLNLESTTYCQKLALETKKAIKMYVSFSFDEALDAIGDKATKIIRCIPNTKNATIQFEGTKETQKGTVNEQVNAVISVDGETGVPIKSFSGGERSSVDLAVDLAVIDYIETKTGKGMNLFILDEPFTGLGTVEIEMALEVLKNSQTNKKLTIVDHNPEVKQMVQNRLVVTRDGLTSKVA